MILLVGKMAHTSSMQDPILASDGEEFQEPNRKVPDVPRISDEFMVCHPLQQLLSRGRGVPPQTSPVNIAIQTKACR